MDYETLNIRVIRSEQALIEYRQGRVIDNRAKINYENLLKIRADTLNTDDVNMFEINQRVDAVIQENADLLF